MHSIINTKVQPLYPLLKQCCIAMEKNSSYIPTSLVIWSFQLWVQIIQIFNAF